MDEGGPNAARRFYAQIYDLVRAVPRGRVTTYGSIALVLGAPGRARQVGYALAALHGYDDVPAHRVVNRSGVLTGEHAFGAPGAMRALLEDEGITFREDGRVDMRRYFWMPCEIVPHSDPGGPA
jgi:methylated-DNA-protein-cysteine methyltransferase related protein